MIRQLLLKMENLDYYTLIEISNHLSYNDFISLSKTNKRINEIKNNIIRHVDHLRDLYFDNDIFNSFSTFVAYKGRLDVLKYIHKKGEIFDNLDQPPIDWAINNEHFHVVKWIHENENNIIWKHKIKSKGCTFKAMDNASLCGNLEIVKWLHENRTEGCSKSAIDYASGGGHVEIVKFLFENRPECGTDIAIESSLLTACRNGHIEIIKYFHKNAGTPYQFKIACEYGHLEIVNYLYTNYHHCRTEDTIIGCSYNRGALNCAYNGGCSEIVKFLITMHPDFECVLLHFIRIHNRSHTIYKKQRNTIIELFDDIYKKALQCSK